MKYLFIFIGLFVLMDKISANDPSELYRKVYKEYASYVEYPVVDTISDNPINNKILEIKNKDGKRLGFVRELITTTGCDSACLPVIATLFYNEQKKFLALKSREGLTRKNHVPWTEKDYQTMEMILLQNPAIFREVTHPKQMVDAITSETLKNYSPYVIFEAAYTSLRLNRYNQDTLQLLQKIK
jgi:hypothetical protein